MIRKLNQHLKKRGVIGTIHQLKQCWSENGFQYTFRQIFKPLKSTTNGVKPVIDTEIAYIVDEAGKYISETTAQSSYLKSYSKQPLKHRIGSLINLLKTEKNYKGVVLYPVSYDLNVKQRPEHILNVLAQEGYLCLMLKIGSDHNTTFMQKRDKRLYYTDLYEECAAYFVDKPVILYLTTPFFYYLTRLFKKAHVVYDVLDDLKIFAGYCEPMEMDHHELLRRSDVVLHSARMMKEKLSGHAHKLVLLENGVWPKDFTAMSEITNKQVKSDVAGIRDIKVGYHGVVSELLNFDIIESILKDSNADVYLIGPVVAFDHTKNRFLQKRVDDLKKYRNLHLLGFIPYENLVHYLQEFDYCIIPFNINEATDGVSPLKLFESIAMRRPVIATGTKTLLEYKNDINILEPEQFAEFIQARKGIRINEQAYNKIIQTNSWPSLVAPLYTHLDRIDLHHTGKKARVTKSEQNIDIININFFDWNGDVLYKGGAERYVYDLAKICQSKGFNARIMQNGNFYFTKEFNGIPVIGVPSKFEHSLSKLSSHFDGFCEKTDMIIASPLDLACDLNPERTIIGINHGIYWDERSNQLQNYQLSRYENIFNALKNVDKAVCVDTNFINWTRTYDWQLAQKCDFIPNYVDTDKFPWVEKDFDGDLTVVYPRRLYEARGLYITIEAFSYLLKKYPRLKLHFVGQAIGNDVVETKKMMKVFPGQVSWHEYEMDEMHKAYEVAHIALVPTMYAEGTSLSCVEAMSMNSAVIATTIGGLPNLIINNHNGILIKPDADELVKAMEKLIGDRKFMERIAANGVHAAQALNKKGWMESWNAVIDQYTVRESPVRQLIQNNA
jgi:glycosyltransferase involved in cell wall biosynthesis